MYTAIAALAGRTWAQTRLHRRGAHVTAVTVTASGQAEPVDDGSRYDATAASVRPLFITLLRK